MSIFISIGDSNSQLLRIKNAVHIGKKNPSINIQSEGLMMSVCVSDKKKKVCKELRLLDQGKRNSTSAPLFFCCTIDA